jgi:hypothetical protein
MNPERNSMSPLLSELEQQAIILAVEATSPGEPIDPASAQRAIEWAMNVVASHEVLAMILKGHIAFAMALDGNPIIEPLYGVRLAEQQAKIRGLFA